VKVYTQEETFMKLKVGVLAIGVLALASLVAAQNAVDGKWAGEVQGGRGPQSVLR